MNELDYDKLLDDWAEELFALADKFEKKMNDEEDYSFKQGVYLGARDAYVNAIARLTMLEKRKKNKYLK